MALADDLTALEGTLVAAKDAQSDEIAPIREAVRRGQESLSQLVEAWSGSDIGYHARLYHESLDRPPLHRSFDVEWGGLHGLDGWVELSLEDVQTLMEERAGITIDELDKSSEELVALAKERRDEVLVVMTPIAGTAGFERETALLSEVEQHVWETQQRPAIPRGYRVTRDSRAMAEGVKVPPHRAIAARLTRVEGRLDACEAFFQLALRAVRQSLQRLRTAADGLAQREALDELGLVLNLIRRFDLVAHALHERGRGRAPLTMDDEYDVQYLLGATLRLHFEDVRPEEWSPSYAGGASRVDFLLKREKIVVEAKRTRSGLADRAIGEELIIDAARYAEHPDCDILVCFVHDPDRRISNPRGLEDDLGRLTRPDGPQVAVVIN